MRRTILRGHALQSEGKPYKPGEESPWTRVSFGQVPGSCLGAGLCECGATSAELDSDAARKRWHAGHKEEVRNG